MSLDLLEPNGLYVLLFIRDDPPKVNDFHWGLYLHSNSDTGGMKYHIRNSGGGWLPDYAIAGDVLKSFLLVGLFQIARIPAGATNDVDIIFKTYDQQLNQLPGLTCRTWVFDVLKLLQKPWNGGVLLKCTDIVALEQEIMAWGNSNAFGASRNKQPRPVSASKLCGL
ncbi:hypothetical protein D6D23_05232 [Aureobasidium pullulans]|uniref:Uncharacterized protein n=1 Tax=Aureobasidium pullulans TaxID=5580 RepID=A0A4S8VCC5_AURPU|nr:hypothetical protein D6D24_09348 [Aureobasidium pullulans]THW24472.1 hypothetical protein D6D23_05232 [Aureobasidium pullulans]